jgi:hypothetical protein
MGTRHIHCLKQPKGNYRFQYLQFDGYPSYQLGRVLKDIMPKVLRLELDFGKATSKECNNTFRAFLDAYLTLRSFDSGHSIGNTWTDKMTTFNSKCWAEYIYIYDPVKVELTVQSTVTGTSFRMPLLDEVQQTDMGFNPRNYGDGQCNETILNAFCKRVEESVKVK